MRGVVCLFFQLLQFCFPDLLPPALGFLETPLICSVNCRRTFFTMLLPQNVQPVGGGRGIYTHVSLTLEPVP